MSTTREVILAVTAVAWIVALGSVVKSLFDVSAAPQVARSILGLWPDPGTGAATVVRVGAVAVLIGGVITYRVLGRASKRRKQGRDESDQQPPPGR